MVAQFICLKGNHDGVETGTTEGRWLYTAENVPNGSTELCVGVSLLLEVVPLSVRCCCVSNESKRRWIVSRSACNRWMAIVTCSCSPDDDDSTTFFMACSN